MLSPTRLDYQDLVEMMGLEPTNLLTASQALYQLSYIPKSAPGTIRTRNMMGRNHPLYPIELQGLGTNAEG
jgi:hypothetical protein